MCRPADYPGDGEQRSVQLQRDSQHVVNKAAVEIYVGAYALVNAALLRNKLRSYLLNRGVQRHIGGLALRLGELLHIGLQHALARVGDGVHRVTHSVYQTLSVERLARQQL